MSRAWLAALALSACGGRAISTPPPNLDAGVDAAGQDRPEEDRADASDPSETHGEVPASIDANPAMLTDGGCVTGASVSNGVCRCVAGGPDVCDEACTDRRTDPENCGACGVRCDATAACRGGACWVVPMLEQKARTPDCMRLRVAVDGGDLYWTDQGAGQVLRAAKGGGAPVVIASGEDLPSELAVRGARVFWLTGPRGPDITGEPAGRSIRVAPATGGAATTVVEVPEGINGFTVSPEGETVYFGTRETVRRVSSTGAGAADVAVSERGGLPRAMVLDGARLVYAEDLTGWIQVVELFEGRVAVCNLHDPEGRQVPGPCTRLIYDNGSLLREAIVVQGGKIFWADGASLKIYDVPTATYPPTAGINDSGGFTAMTGGADRIFLATTSTIVDVASEPAESPVLQLARGQKTPKSIATDGARVYWSDADCAIWSIAP